MKVVLTDPFWSEIRGQMATVGLAHQFEQIVSTGRLENFRLTASGDGGGHGGRCYDDSDVYKWLEAASYATGLGQEPEGIVPTISAISDAQAGDGYLHTWSQLGHGSGRWSSLCADHEAYCMGHLIEAGVAHFGATGSRALLDIAERSAGCLETQFGQGGLHAACGHQEAEIALARLAGVTGNQRYRALGARMIAARGLPASAFKAECQIEDGPSARYRPLVVRDGQYDGAYSQDHAPLEECSEVVGHAVRAMYYFCGAMDCATDGRYDDALGRLWTNLVGRRMYITGGIGSAGANEGFTADYDLPNRQAYAETCAAIGLVMWALRMARRAQSAEAVGVLLRALYNAVLSGVSQDARGYFYANPLESQGEHARRPWFECACCPPNIARLVLSVERYLAWDHDGGLVLAAPVAGRYEVGGHVVNVESDYPRGNDFTLAIETQGTIAVRVADPFGGLGTLSWDGGEARSEDGWLVANALGRGVVRGRLGHAPEFVRSHPLVPENAGRLAAVDGPIVYCAEAVAGEPSPNAFRVRASAEPQRISNCLRVEGTDLSVGGPLYAETTESRGTPRSLDLVPYSTWSNRGPSVMRVWLAEA